MSSVIAAGGEAKDRQEDVDQRGRQASHLGARGRVLQPAHGRLRTQVAPTLRRPADRQLEQRIGAQIVAVVGILVAAGDREHAEPQHRRQRVDHPVGGAPLPDAAGQRLGQAEPAFRRAQQHQPAVRGDRPRRRKSAVTFLRCTAGRSNGRRVSSVMAGVALSLLRRKSAGKRISTR